MNCSDGEERKIGGLGESPQDDIHGRPRQRYWLLECALAVMLGTAVAAPDLKDLEDIAKGIRQAGFVCEPPFEMRPVGQTERGMQVRFICNNQTLMYRITLAPDGQRATIRPWSE